MKMKEELIRKIEGGNRWSKDGKDRLYFDDDALGYKYERYKSSGYVYSAEVEKWPYLEGADMKAVNAQVGEKMSNKEATNLANCRHYIDLNTWKIHSFGFFKARIEYLVLKAKKALETEGKAPNGEDSEMTLAELKELVLSKTFHNVKRSDDKKFALVTIEIEEKGSRFGSDIFKIAIHLKRKTIEHVQRFHKSPDGHINTLEKERLNIYLKSDQEMAEFEKAHDWHDWTEEESKAPTPTH